MIRPRRVLALILALAALVVLAAFVALPAPTSAAPAAKRAPLFSHPVHRGSSGKQVRAIQWLLSGHAPNAYRATIHPLKGRPITGQCGKRCVQAILAARWRLGEPLKYDKSCRCRPVKQARFTRDLYLLLTGKQARPLIWIGRASTRISIIKKKQRARQASSCARKAVAIAYREYRIGVREEPDGSNWGVKGRASERIRWYQSVTGAYHAAWCASFVQAVYQWSGVGTVANRSAGVFYIADWGRSHRPPLVFAFPVVGAEVLYMRNLGHTGIVVAVNHTTVTTIEGNYSNRVSLVTHPLGYAQTVFLYPPCILAAARSRH